MDTDTPSPPPSVLLVEPDPALAARYTGWLEDEYDVRTAENETTAIDAISEEIDAVIFDRRVSNPDSSSGAEPLRRAIRDREIDCHVAMIVAAEPSFDVTDRGLDDYIVGPISATELRSVVDRFVLRATCDDQLRTFYDLASKRALLDRDRHDAELAASPRYAALEDRLAVARTRADETMADLLASADDRCRRGAIRDVLCEDEP